MPFNTAGQSASENVCRQRTQVQARAVARNRQGPTQQRKGHTPVPIVSITGFNRANALMSSCLVEITLCHTQGVEQQKKNIKRLLRKDARKRAKLAKALAETNVVFEYRGYADAVKQSNNVIDKK